MSCTAFQQSSVPAHSGRWPKYPFPRIVLAMYSLMLMAVVMPVHAVNCPDTGIVKLEPNTKPTPPAEAPNLEVTGGECTVPAGTYYFKNVNIHSGGTLKFDDATTYFWANSILIENSGSLIAGKVGEPIGTANPANVLTFYLYGKQEGGTFGTDTNGGKGVLCRTPDNDGTGPPCGIPAEVWGDGKTPTNYNGDLFYRYRPLPYDGGYSKDERDGQDKQGYFGYKVLAVSFGGTLNLFGKKGTISDAKEYEPDLSKNSGQSWARLQMPASDKDGRLGTDGKTLFLDRPVDWRERDRIVVSTTDYLPTHSEELEITKRLGDTEFKFTRVDDCKKEPCGVQWPHNGRQYDFSKVKDSDGTTVKDKLGLKSDKAETRAAVGLLSRNIRIVSGGDRAGDLFPGPEVIDPITKKPYDFGGHTIARQGFKEFKVQGVEFQWLGQGGRIGHYPVHFHLARQTPKETYVKDSSINESMTRWIVIHGTGGVSKTAKDTETVLESVLLARNVGYKSIGHGFYLEDGSEANNRLYYNLGIFARAAVTVPASRLKKEDQGMDPHNPRRVPGILAAYMAPYGENFPYRSDYDHPTAFWIMNSWNEFVGNMAAGTGTCGAGYWLVPGQNSGPSGLDYQSYLTAGTPNPAQPNVDLTCKLNMQSQMQWKGYASLQQCGDNAGATPLKRFSGNSALASMNSLMTVETTTACLGISVNDPGNNDALQAVENPLAPKDFQKYSRIDPYPQRPNTPLTPPGCDPNRTDCNPGYWGKLKNQASYDYYPNVSGGVRKPTLCPDDSQDCSKIDPCSFKDRGNCTVNVIDGYTTSFHWAETNFSAVWLRSPAWFLLTDSVISDVQNGGLTFVTGGGYSRSDAIEGFWSLARKSVFIGKTQKGNPYAAAKGPFDGNPNAEGKVVSNCTKKDNYCVSFDGQISMPLSNWAVNQRLFNIYDGPSLQDSNAYLDIQPTVCAVKDPNCDYRKWMYGGTPGIRKIRGDPANPDDDQCYLPHAAIGWKQPNGFYYPPAFHSVNLFFDDVNIRHYVIEPAFDRGTYHTDKGEVVKRFCGLDGKKGEGAFRDYTDIDRQTVLNDDDGSLTGLCAREAGLGLLTGTCKAGAEGGLRETISVNEDDYFDTPAEVPQCRSNVGVRPSSACDGPRKTRPTAKTSPEEYVTTVIYPDPPLPEQPNPWDSECTNQKCFGVPLYRQKLTEKEYKEWTKPKNQCDKVGQGEKPKPGCNWPFIRMAGQNIGFGQRSTLTANHGQYYIDTTVPESIQREDPGWVDPLNGHGRFVNVFQGKRKYHVFFVFAKDSMRQTYRIYVGKNMKHHTDDTGKVVPNDDVVMGERANPADGAVRFGPSPVAWPAEYLTKEYDPETGILTVSVDLSSFGSLLDPKNRSNGLCKPASFCKWQDDKTVSECTSALAEGHPLYPQSLEACGTWAVKDLDCPLAPDENNNPAPACIGFAFIMPGEGFAPDGLNHRPPPLEMKSTGSILVPVSKPVAGQQCTYTLDDLSCLPK